MEKNIISSIEETKNNLVDLINSFTEDQFSKVPFEGSWTAGQVADHIIKSASGLPATLTGATIPTERDPAEKTESVKNIFLDMKTKMKSPDFIIPSNPPHDKEIMAKKTADIFTSITDTAKKLDLTETCTVFELPGSGPFTRLEWLHFILYHTQRHEMQMRKVFENVLM